jgi:hypothetical protein
MTTEKSRLEKMAVAHWLEGQRAASAKIEEERTKFLLSLTPEQAFAIYVMLPHDEAVLSEVEQPSFILQAMRRALRHRPHHVSP